MYRFCSVDYEANQARCHIRRRRGRADCAHEVAATTAAGNPAGGALLSSKKQQMWIVKAYSVVEQIVNLKKSLRNVALGKAFVLQGGSSSRLFLVTPLSQYKFPSGYLRLCADIQETALNYSTTATRR